MNTKPRFTNEQQIIDAIDRCRSMAANKLAESERLRDHAIAIYKELGDSQAKRTPSGYGAAYVEADEAQEKSKKLRRAATNLLDKKAKMLGEKLSEFRTKPLIPLDGKQGIGDMSVEGVK